MENFAPNELEKRVDEVLFYVWDPCSVNDEPCARAEYRSYVASVTGLLKNGKTVAEIAGYLCRIESESRGKTPNENHALMVANTLVQHKDAIEEGLA